MMLFVFLLDVMQNLQRLFCRSRFYDDLLESAFQSTILFYTLAIFVEGGGSDALDESTCQSWFHDVGSIHASFCTARANQRVDFIDENDDVRVSFQFLDDALDALLKLTSILGAGNNACHVETQYSLVEEEGTLVALGNHLCQSFYDGTFAHARLTY